MGLLLIILSIILIVAGVFTLISGSVLFGIILIVVGIVLWPGAFLARR